MRIGYCGVIVRNREEAKVWAEQNAPSGTESIELHFEGYDSIKKTEKWIVSWCM